jgi:hypothetical protein
MEPWPPALLKRERKEERKGEKFYIYSDVTHTHGNAVTRPFSKQIHWFSLISSI